MARQNIRVDFGFEMPNDTTEGTLIVIDSFEQSTKEEIEKIFHLADEREFCRVVFYPQHETTLKRMDILGVRPYHKRVKYLEELLSEADNGFIPHHLDKWEGKRKKYTPFETALSFLKEKHKGPYFLYVKSEVANKLVHYGSFEKIIKETRLFIDLHGTENLDSKWLRFKDRYEGI